MSDFGHKSIIIHFENELNEQKTLMNDAMFQLNEGKTPLLAGFEERIVSLCERIEKAPAVVAHALKYDMKEMIGLAEELVQAIEAHRANLQNKLDNQEKH